MCGRSLHPVALPHKALEARPVDQVEGQLFVREHGEGQAAGVGHHLGSLLDGHCGVLSDDLRDHVDDDLQAADFAALFFEFFCGLERLAWLFRGVFITENGARAVVRLLGKVD